MEAKDRLIVALDVDSMWEANDLVHELGDTVSRYKVGWQLFMSEGFDVVYALTDADKKVFLDLKLDDIPNTVYSTLKNMKPYVEFFSLQGDIETYRAAVKGFNKARSTTKLLYVLSLSTRSGYGDLATAIEVAQAGGGLVVSGHMVQAMRERFPCDVTIVTPGIRLNEDVDDHTKVFTPAQAIEAGSDFLVVGR
ncbi:hypothetical protein LCGC14_1370870, partial [marine sediment metagenome]